MKFKILKSSLMTALFAALSMTACHSKGSLTTSPSASDTLEITTVNIDVRFVDFGDDISFTVSATDHSNPSIVYSSDPVTISTGSEVPADGEASITEIPYGIYDFAIDVKDSAGNTIVAETYDNAGSGYEIRESLYEVAFTINLGDGDSTSGTVSSYTSTVTVTATFDFPPTPSLDVNEVSLAGDFGTATDYVTATFDNNAVAFYDYEDADSTSPVDLCTVASAADQIDLSFKVQNADASTSCALSTSNITLNYFDGSSYAASSCSGLDCCRFEVTLNESALASCSGITFEDYKYFQVTLTGSDSNDNSASAVVNIDINP